MVISYLFAVFSYLILGYLFFLLKVFYWHILIENKLKLIPLYDWGPYKTRGEINPDLHRKLVAFIAGRREIRT